VHPAVLREILEHERRIMPARVRAHLDEVMRQAGKWRQRQSKPAKWPLGPYTAAVDARKALSMAQRHVTEIGIRHFSKKLNSLKESPIKRSWCWGKAGTLRNDALMSRWRHVSNVSTSD
jgi:hypothetical protein